MDVFVVSFMILVGELVEGCLYFVAAGKGDVDLVELFRAELNLQFWIARIFAFDRIHNYRLLLTEGYN